MNEFIGLLGDLRELGTAIWEEGDPTRTRWWRRSRQVIQNTLWTLIFWPLGMILFAMLPVGVARTIVPIMALVPLAVGLYFAVRLANPATFAAWALFPKVRSILKKVGLCIGVELALGVYLSTVPVSNDRGLIPLLVLAVLALTLLRVGGVRGWAAKALMILLVVLTLIFVLGGRDKVVEKADDAWEHITGKSEPTSNPAPNMRLTFKFEPVALCEVGNIGEENNHDFSKEVPVPEYLELDLGEGCWSGWTMKLPEAWGDSWNWQLIQTKNSEWPWVAFWFTGHFRHNGPFCCGDHPTMMAEKQFRIQGRGKIRFYSLSHSG